jgi:signal transduction histidine kinase
MNQNVLRSQTLRSYSMASSPDALSFLPDRVDRRFRSHAVAGLEQALSALSAEFPLGRTRLRIFVTGKARALDSCVQEQVYLVAREALHNALRHAQATNVEAEIEYSAHRFRVMVRDNGRGIRPDALVRSGSWGLLQMRERATEIGAQLRIWSREGAGTEVEISVPAHIAELSPLPA